MKHQVMRRAAVFNDPRRRQSAQNLLHTLIQPVATQLTIQIDYPQRRRVHNSSRFLVRTDVCFNRNRQCRFTSQTRVIPRNFRNHVPANSAIQSRSVASWASEFMQDFSIWGGTGVVLTSLHSAGLPYWTSFSAMNFMLRASLLPLVIYGAKTAARYAKVAPEIQFIVTLFQNDLKKIRAEGKSLLEQRHLFLQNLETVRTIYNLHNINPLTVFLSPFLQIPFFYYVATDLRKIVNGSDPELAQELTESSFLWVPDLTDPDPWFGLPIAAGAMLYFNVEVAIGKRSLSGPAASQSDFAGLLKDLFQTLAVFMPCFAAQSPAGLQIYLVSSFTWTLFQSAALRNDTMRGWVNLPAMGNPPTEPKYAKEFMEFKKLEQKAKEIRGDGPVLGRNVLAVGFETSFPGTNRPSTICGSDLPPQTVETENDTYSSAELPSIPKLSMEQASAAWGGQYIHGISAPMNELEDRVMNELREERVKEIASEKLTSEQGKFMPQGSETEMKAANLGVKMTTAESELSKSLPLQPTVFKRRKGNRVPKKRGGKATKKRKQ
mmetsp:Transcript_21418/g.59569  ORF Transcript_21418/g.59569 Transcript_21418/m.59569 type:complete len:548 (-) Transcript_21418:760-2403(-)